MSTQTIEPTSRIVGSSSTIETTTARAVILRQIRALQKSEAGLAEQLAKLGTDTASIEARIALQQQIRGIEDQIKALQTALLQTDADRQVQVTRIGEEEVKRIPAAQQAQQKESPESGSETLGTLIDTVA
jgi:seryl-tRNA synthetase